MADRRLVTISMAFYRRLLLLYPAAFRHEYGREMLFVFHDQCRDANHRFGIWGIALIWIRSSFDLVVNAWGERWAMQNRSARNRFALLVSGEVALLLSWIFLLWAILLATLFLDPWETAIWARPVGTLAGAVSRFFGRTPGIFLPASLVLLLQFRSLLMLWRVSSRGRLVWMYALTNTGTAVAMLGGTLGAMRLTRLLLPQFFMESSDFGYGRTILSIAVFILLLIALFRLQARLAAPERTQPDAVI